MQLISDKIQIIRFYLSLVRSVAYGESEVKLFACNEIINRWQFSFSKGEKWYDKLFNVNYLPLFHHFKAIFQFPKHIVFLVKIVANAALSSLVQVLWISVTCFTITYRNVNIFINQYTIFITIDWSRYQIILYIGHFYSGAFCRHSSLYRIIIHTVSITDDY